MKIYQSTVTQELLNAIAELDEFKGAWRLLGKLSPERLKQLQKTALIKTVTAHLHASGSTITEQQTAQVLRAINADSFPAEVDQMAAGYLFVLQEIAMHYNQLSCTQLTIKQLHRWLCRYQKSVATSAGQYKKRPNQVVAAGGDNAISCLLSTTALPYQVEVAMEELLYAASLLRSQKQLHPLQIIALFVARFLLIHPFDQHNHLMVQILLELMLLHYGYGYVPYIAMVPLHQDKEQLYAMLSRLYKGSEIQEQPYQSWMRFFLQRLLDQKRSLELVIEREQTLNLHISDYAATVLGLLQEHGKLSLGELVQLTGFNKHTAKKHVQELVKKQQIVMHGKARATWYTIL